MPRWLRALLVLGCVGAVLVVVGVEVAGRVVTERIAEQQLRAAGVAGGVEVTVGRSWWRPSLLPALLTGDLDRVSVELTDAELFSMPVLEADYVLEDLGVDVSLRRRTITATSLGAGKVRVLVDPAAIGSLLGVSAIARDGQVLVGSDLQPATLRVVGPDLQITSDALVVGDHTASIQVADPQLLPCDPAVRVVGELVELACTGDTLPGILERSIGVGGTVDPPDAPTELEPPATLELPATTPTPTTPTTTPPAASVVPDDTPPGGNDGGG